MIAIDLAIDLGILDAFPYIILCDFPSAGNIARHFFVFSFDRLSTSVCVIHGLGSFICVCVELSTITGPINNHKNGNI